MRRAVHVVRPACGHPPALLRPRWWYTTTTTTTTNCSSVVEVASTRTSRGAVVVRSLTSSSSAGDDDSGGEWFGEEEEEREKGKKRGGVATLVAKPHRTLFEKTRRVAESELEEKFIKGGGPGGQKINKTNSCVYLKHVPTGIEVKCQEQRERGRNRTIARQILHEKLMQLYFPEESKTFKRQEKIRRRKERMGRRYGRNEPLELSPSSSVASVEQDPSPSSPSSSPSSSPKGDRDGGEHSQHSDAKDHQDAPQPAETDDAEVPTAQRRRARTEGLPDFVFEQLGVRRADVAECTIIDPEEFSASSDDDDDEDREGDDDEDEDALVEGAKDGEDDTTKGKGSQPGQDKTPTDLPNFLLDQLGIKTR